jgi:hypothetical protein
MEGATEFKVPMLDKQQTWDMKAAVAQYRGITDVISEVRSKEIGPR